jgi:hypothetical protein
VQRAMKVQQVPSGQQVRPALKVQRVMKVQQVPLGQRGRQAQKARTVQAVQQVQLARLELKAIQVQLGLRV